MASKTIFKETNPDEFSLVTVKERTVILDQYHLFDLGGRILSLHELQQAVIDAEYYRKELEALKREVCK